jgi:hypothetical protein
MTGRSAEMVRGYVEVSEVGIATKVIETIDLHTPRGAESEQRHEACSRANR